MSRNPWRPRTLLAALVAALAGAGITATVTADELDTVLQTVVAVATAVITLLAELGIVRDGEAETTPVGDPLGPDGLPMLTWAQVEQLLGQGAAAGEPGQLTTERITELYRDRE